MTPPNDDTQKKSPSDGEYYPQLPWPPEHRNDAHRAQRPKNQQAPVQANSLLHRIQWATAVNRPGSSPTQEENNDREHWWSEDVEPIKYHWPPQAKIAP
jgi:hypothetical protein